MLRVGAILHGTYRIDGYLASGGFGNTYVATNVQFDERVAIKEFFMKGITQRDANNTTVSVSNVDSRNTFEEQREKFKKEARRLRRLHSEHIVTVHDLFEENGTAYYVMDYIEGENLNERLRRTGVPMSEASALDVIRQVLDALEVAHNADVADNGKKGILHLDIKPANIMIDHQGKVKLIDFGASKQISSAGGATTSTAISYTMGYAPREQMEQNLDKFGPWTDIYALGATLYTLLSNRRPPLPSDIDDDKSGDKHIALPIPTSVSDEAQQLVRNMMQTERNNRPQSIAAVRDLLRPTPEDDTILNVPGSDEDSEALYKLGLKYAEGDGVPQDFTMAVHYYAQAANMGNASAQLLLGACYNEGQGVERNYHEAVKWYTKAALQGNANAQNDLGNLYYEGRGVERNYKMAVDWYNKAAQKGNSSAQFNLGLCCQNGKGVEQDYYEAAEWYTKAAEQGDVGAQNNLGWCYENGQGVEQDYYEAAEWYTKAAEQGDADAQNNLGLCYENGRGVEQDYQLAVEWYTKAAQQGIATAQFNLGLCYENGRGVEQDDQLAIEWYTKAAQQGNADAQNNLGSCYENGQGVEQDYYKAAEWYKKAAQQGNATAQYNLGYCYENGDGVEQNNHTAVEWYRKAAEQGEEDAQYRLDMLLQPNGGGGDGGNGKPQESYLGCYVSIIVFVIIISIIVNI